MEVEGEMCGFDSKKAALFCSGSPYRTVSVCVRQNEEKKQNRKKTRNQSYTKKSYLSYRTAEYTGPKEHTPRTDVAVHYVATHTHT